MTDTPDFEALADEIYTRFRQFGGTGLDPLRDALREYGRSMHARGIEEAARAVEQPPGHPPLLRPAERIRALAKEPKP